MIAIRDASAIDRDYLRGLFAALRAQEWGASGLSGSALEALLAMQFEAQERDYRRHFPDSRCQVIVCEGRPIGRLWLTRSSPEIRILDIGIEPRMQRRGIGSGILRTILSEADAADLPVTLSVAGDNPARRLYRRLGFEVIAEHPPYIDMQWHGASTSRHRSEICDEQA
jgi:ribosomal protein S18 acetylase RimI-like enzyme